MCHTYGTTPTTQFHSSPPVHLPIHLSIRSPPSFIIHGFLLRNRCGGVDLGEDAVVQVVQPVVVEAAVVVALVLVLVLGLAGPVMDSQMPLPARREVGYKTTGTPSTLLSVILPVESATASVQPMTSISFWLAVNPVWCDSNSSVVVVPDPWLQNKEIIW